MSDTVEIVRTSDYAPVVHGRWKDRHVYGIDECTVDTLQSARCTNCGKYHTTPYMYYFDDFAYCPYCGAKMDGERRENDAQGND